MAGFEGSLGAVDPQRARKAYEEAQSARRAAAHVDKYRYIDGMKRQMDEWRGKGSADKAPDAGHEGTGK